MRRLRTAIFFILLLTPTSLFSQKIEALSELRYVVDGVKKFDIVDGIILTDKSAKPKLKAVGYLLLEAKGKKIAISAKDKDHNRVKVKTLSVKDGMHEFLVLGSGKINIDAFIVDWESQEIDFQFFTLNIVDEDVKPEPEPDKPDPDKPDEPDPTIPDDDFDNLGQRVYIWSKGLEKRKEAAEIYKQSADMLKGDPTRTIDDVANYMVKSLKEKIDYEAYASLRANVNADLQQRWSIAPLPRGVLADYYMAIHNGLNY